MEHGACWLPPVVAAPNPAMVSESPSRDTPRPFAPAAAEFWSPVPETMPHLAVAGALLTPLCQTRQTKRRHRARVVEQHVKSPGNSLQTLALFAAHPAEAKMQVTRSRQRKFSNLESGPHPRPSVSDLRGVTQNVPGMLGDPWQQRKREFVEWLHPSPDLWKLDLARPAAPDRH